MGKQKLALRWLQIPAHGSASLWGAGFSVTEGLVLVKPHPSSVQELKTFGPFLPWVLITLDNNLVKGYSCSSSVISTQPP